MVRRLPGLLLAAVLGCAHTLDLDDGPDAPDERFVWSTLGVTNAGTPWLRDSVVFYVGSGHVVTALSRLSGAVIWQSTLPSPAIAPGGGVSVGELILVGYGDLFGLDPATGAIVWRFAAAAGQQVGRFEPVAWKGLVFTGSNNGWIFAVDPANGQPLWSIRVAQNTRTVVYLGQPSGDLLPFTVTDFDVSPNFEPQGQVGVLNAVTRTVVWQRDIPHHVVETSPTASLWPVVTGSVVVTGARDGPVYGFDLASGAQRWKVAPFQLLHDPPVELIRDLHWIASCRGRLFIGTSGSTLVASIDPESGAQHWRTPVSSASAEPIFCDDDYVFVLRPRGGIEVLDARSGDRMWELRGSQSDFGFGGLSDGALVYLGGVEGAYALRRD